MWYAGDVVAFQVDDLDALEGFMPGIASSAHLSNELFNAMAGVKIVHVPYRGSAPAITDLLAGQIHMMNEINVLPHAKAGKLNLLCMNSPERVPAFPDTPTLAETLPGFVSSSWVGAFLPPKTPQARRGRWARNRRPARCTFAGASSRSIPVLPSRQRPSTCRLIQCRRR